jgi:hypothetical protein
MLIQVSAEQHARLLAAVRAAHPALLPAVAPLEGESLAKALRVETTFADCVKAFAEPEGCPFVAAAQEGSREGEVEVDGSAVVSDGADDGLYCMAWVWVSDADAGLGTTRNRLQYLARAQPAEDAQSAWLREAIQIGDACLDDEDARQEPLMIDAETRQAFLDNPSSIPPREGLTALLDRTRATMGQPVIDRIEAAIERVCDAIDTARQNTDA